MRTKLLPFLAEAPKKILGYSHEELVGKETPMRFHIEEEISSHAKEFSERTGKNIKGLDLFAEIMIEGPERHDWTYKKKDGSLISVELTVTPIRDD